MRVTVTPLGVAGGSGAAAAGAVVAYFEGVGVAGSPGRQLLGPAPRDAVVAYYADSIEGPGQWWGSGAALLGLAGTVAGEDLRQVLSGRHPVSGERLVSARGSAGRWALKVGQPTRLDGGGEALYDVRDAASVLGISVP